MVYVGMYICGESEGIYCCEFDLESGEFSDLELVVKVMNFFFVVIYDNGKFFYVVSEISNFDGCLIGGVSVYWI